MDLPELRTQIDALDDEILRLLNERARLAGHVATVKEQLNAPFYVPSRERAIIERLMAVNAGPFPNESIRPVFQEIFSACLSLEKKVRVAFLGPEATYTHLAAKRQFGLSARATLVEATSNAEGARMVGSDAHGAAVASEMAARQYDLEVIRRKIEDLTSNVTRFLVIGKAQATPTGADKTSVLMVLKDEPGILYKVLAPLSKRALNLTKIESRPSRRRAWEYVFFVDIDGHQSDPAVEGALAELRGAAETMKVLGSYPRGQAG
jgi:chorismate mutase-like protein